MRHIASLFLALLAVASVVIRITLLLPDEDPDASLLLLPSLSAVEPPPPPPLESLDAHAISGEWQPPSWPPLPAPRRYPLFAVTAWFFPSYSLAVQFYRGSGESFPRMPPHVSPDRLRQAGRRSASVLADACTSPRVGISVRRLVERPDRIRVPLILHRVYIDRKPIWILIIRAFDPTDPPDPALFQGWLYSTEVHLLAPWSGESLCSAVWL